MTVNNGKSIVQCPIHHIILIMSVPIQVFRYNNNLLTFILLYYITVRTYVYSLTHNHTGVYHKDFTLTNLLDTFSMQYNFCVIYICVFHIA